MTGDKEQVRRPAFRHIWIPWMVVTAVVTVFTRSRLFSDLLPWPYYRDQSLFVLGVLAVLAGAAQGLVLGLAQALLLRHFFKGLKWLLWAPVMAIGYGAILLVFSLADPLLPARDSHGFRFTPLEESAVLGVLGLLGGTLQAPFLGRWLPGRSGPRSWIWPLFHGAALAVGPVIPFVLPFSHGEGEVMRGVSLGLITGLGLQLLLRQSGASKKSAEPATT